MDHLNPLIYNVPTIASNPKSHICLLNSKHTEDKLNKWILLAVNIFHWLAEQDDI